MDGGTHQALPRRVEQVSQAAIFPIRLLLQPILNQPIIITIGTAVK